MTRGPLPARGFAAALPVAKARGHVQFFRRERGNRSDLMIAGALLAIVRVAFAPKLHGTPEEIAREFREHVRQLRLYPSIERVSRELWLYSRYGVLRFFRVLENGIAEIGADGKEPAPEPDVPARVVPGGLAVPGTPGTLVGCPGGPDPGSPGGQYSTGPVSGPD